MRCRVDGNQPIRLQGRETSCHPRGHLVDGPAPPGIHLFKTKEEKKKGEVEEVSSLLLRKE